MDMIATQPPLAELEEKYRELASWCDVMQALADFLPCHIDAQVSDNIRANLVALVDRIHGLEEAFLFPAIAGCYGCETAAEIAIERRRKDRQHDRDATQNLVNIFHDLQSNSSELRSETIAYTLRSLAQRMRRHIAAESELLNLLRRKAA
ncbi:hemerythrin domain-containing protein [Rhizobium sp. BK377]|jgi:hemerythrin-like domain-containing protein|uniref:hemerythrin domain-containing protein n=1 Tax=Rhizobium sp. BK377 TaxID=2587058 RepID=UPI001615C478|nr:hemerythrin domain-containing protein [Rhizobium sp. BK377]MBB3463120.1 hemerythrin-like domain-containing protein [Rhizobium sp. BK377]